MPAKSRNNVSGPQLARAVGGRRPNHQHTHAPANPFAHFPPPPANKKDGIPLPPPPQDKRDGLPLPLPPYHAVPYPPHVHNIDGPDFYGPDSYSLPPSAPSARSHPPPPSHSLNHGSKHSAAGKRRTGSQAGTGFSKQGHSKAKPHYNKRNGPPPPFAQSFDPTPFDDAIFYDNPPAPPKPAPKKAILHGPPAARRQSSFLSASSSSASASSLGSAVTIHEREVHVSDDSKNLVELSTFFSPRTGTDTRLEIIPIKPGRVSKTTSVLTHKPEFSPKDRFMVTPLPAHEDSYRMRPRKEYK